MFLQADTSAVYRDISTSGDRMIILNVITDVEILSMLIHQIMHWIIASSGCWFHTLLGMLDQVVADVCERRAQHKKRTLAALKIQTTWRRYTQHRKYHRCLRAVITIQVNRVFWLAFDLSIYEALYVRSINMQRNTFQVPYRYK